MQINLTVAPWHGLWKHHINWFCQFIKKVQPSASNANKTTDLCHFGGCRWWCTVLQKEKGRFDLFLKTHYSVIFVSHFTRTISILYQTNVY